jgi:hypothetical protein
MLLAALRGREAEAIALIEATINDAIAGGEGLAVQFAHWTTAVLYNGLGRYEEALAAAERVSDDPPELFLSAWALTELIVASTRTRNERRATDALDGSPRVRAPRMPTGGSGSWPAPGRW